MTRYFLKSLSIEGFRGINNDGDPLILNFKPDCVNSVHAQNGFGKSSIFEALQFAIFGSVPRLAQLQGAEQADSYLVNKFHPNGEANISMLFCADDGTDDVSISVKRNAHLEREVTSSSGHVAPESFLAALREDFVLVDYAGFADFVDTSALERGRSFASLVGLSRYSNLRRALTRAKNTGNINNDLGLAATKAEAGAVEKNISVIDTRILAAQANVTGVEVAVLSDLQDHKDTVTQSLNKIGLIAPHLEGKSVMDLDFAAAEKAIEAEEGGAARKQVDTLTTNIAELTPLELTEAEKTNVEEIVQLAQQRDDAVKNVGATVIRDLLGDALKVVDDDNWTDPNLCPVCDESSEPPLKQKLTAKLALYDEATKLDVDLIERVEASDGISKLRNLEELASMGVPNDERLHQGLMFKLREKSVSTENLSRALARLDELEKIRRTIIEEAQKELEALQKDLPPSLLKVSQILSAAKQFRDAVIEYEKDAPELENLQKRLAVLDRWQKFIGTASKTFGDAETKLASDRIIEIQDSCQGLFENFTRGGPNVKPTLSRAANSENVDLTLEDFYGLEGLNARALLSESYRNAVAASIFLSAATKHSGAPRFMVLDDVTSSFDAGHQFGLMEALRSQLRYSDANPDESLQFIVLSHDTSLEKYFDKLNNTSDWHHQKLQGMPPKGRLMASAQEADRLKNRANHYLDAGNTDDGAPYVRQYLEYKLGQIISKLEVPVPPDYANRGDKRTLSTYLGAIEKAVDLYVAANLCVLEPQQVADIKNTHVPTLVANFVSHYETGAGAPFNAYALKGVLERVDDLADCFRFTDPASGARKLYRRLDKKD